MPEWQITMQGEHGLKRRIGKEDAGVEPSRHIFRAITDENGRERKRQSVERKALLLPCHSRMF
jgi:hypothetical protein